MNFKGIYIVGLNNLMVNVITFSLFVAESKFNLRECCGMLFPPNAETQKWDSLQNESSMLAKAYWEQSQM